MIETKQEWVSLNCLVKIEAERYIKSTGKTEKETRLYISGLPADAKLINQSVRAHWGVENSLHWVLEQDSMKMPVAKEPDLSHGTILCSTGLR